MILPIAWFVIGSVDHRLPDVHAYVTCWMWVVAAAGAWGTVECVRHHINSVQAFERYVQGYRAWKSQQDQERQETERRQAEEAKRRQDAQALAQAQADRRRRLSELEALVLRAQAQHAVGADFFGAKSPLSLLAEFRVHLRQLNLADLGMLRESQNPVLRQIIGDGAFLPPCPPLRLPSTSPA